MGTARKTRLPDEAACLKIMDRFGMPEHVIRHSRTVCAVAMFLTRQLNGKGLRLDEDLVRAAALLHDITKRYSFNRPLDHSLTGAKVLKYLGYPDIASIVRQHVRVSSSRPPGRISEPEIVNYSDKRVVEDRITTLDERLDYIRKRYGKTPEAVERISRFASATYQVEHEIFSILLEDPAQILFISQQEVCDQWPDPD